MKGICLSCSQIKKFVEVRPCSKLGIVSNYRKPISLCLTCYDYLKQKHGEQTITMKIGFMMRKRDEQFEKEFNGIKV